MTQLQEEQQVPEPFQGRKKEIRAAENILSKFSAYFPEGSIPLSSEEKGFNALPHSGLGIYGSAFSCG